VPGSGALAALLEGAARKSGPRACVLAAGRIVTGDGRIHPSALPWPVLLDKEAALGAAAHRLVAVHVVPESVVEHRTKEAHTAVSSSGERYHFHVRNTLFTLRGSAWNGVEKATLVYLLAITTVAYLEAADRRRRALQVIASDFVAQYPRRELEVVAPDEEVSRR